jgi:AraC family transcriptional regulator of arabinose operon
MANDSGARVQWVNRRAHTERASFGQVQYEPGGFCGPRRQRQYQLVILHSGTCRVRVDGVERDIELGEVHLFRPKHRELFTFSATNKSEHSWCSLRQDFLPPTWAKEIQTAPASAVMSPLFQRLLSLSFDLGGLVDAQSERVVEQLALSAFAEYLSMSRRQPDPARVEPGIARALQYIEEKHGETDCLKSLAKVAGCSPSTLGRRFRAVTGLTPTRYLWRLRTEKGVAMLRETGLPAFEIAARCGFSNPFHFSRYVRRTTGDSPRVIRTRAWGE